MRVNLPGTGQAQRCCRQGIQPFRGNVGAAPAALAVGSGGYPGQGRIDLADFGGAGLSQFNQDLVTFAFGGLFLPVRGPRLGQGTADLPQPGLQLAKPVLQSRFALGMICHFPHLFLQSLTLPWPSRSRLDAGQPQRRLSPAPTRRYDRLNNPGGTMDIRHLSADYAVSPQIATEDIATLKARGFATVICNRPDPEIPADIHAAVIGPLVEAAGMAFVVNPVIGGALTTANVAAQAAAIAAATGPVFAYCASGNRSSIIWALSQAGTRSADELIGAGAKFGYQLEGLRSQIEALAAARG